MKLKTLAILALVLLIGLCGCGSKESNSDKEQELNLYNVEINFYNEYSVCDLDNIFIYFPVVTNKKITSTELGGVGAKVNLKHANISSGLLKITLLAENQDHINIKYSNYYISFLKYKLKYASDTEINYFNSIELDDTKLWISCNEEFQSVDFNAVYLKIYTVQDCEEQESPNWNQLIDRMTVEIQQQIELLN